MEPEHPQGSAVTRDFSPRVGPWGGVQEPPVLSEGGGMFGERLARGSGSCSPAADGGEVPGRLGGFSRALLGWPSPRAANPPASSLVPLAEAMALKRWHQR